MGQTMSANDTQPAPAEAATDVGADDVVDELDRSFAFVAITAVVAVATIALLTFFWPSV